MLPTNPNQPQPGVPVGPGPGVSPGGGNPDAIKGQLVQLLKQARKVAEQNGVDWSSVLAEVEGNKVRSEVPLPRPPSALP